MKLGARIYPKIYFLTITVIPRLSATFSQDSVASLIMHEISLRPFSVKRRTALFTFFFQQSYDFKTAFPVTMFTYLNTFSKKFFVKNLIFSWVFLDRYIRALNNEWEPNARFSEH